MCRMRLWLKYGGKSAKADNATRDILGCQRAGSSLCPANKHRECNGRVSSVPGCSVVDDAG